MRKKHRELIHFFRSDFNSFPVANMNPAELAAAIEQELQREATRDYLKDPIPPAYQKPVSEYFEALSKESQRN